MALIAPVNLPFNVKTLWFDPNGLELNAGDKVVVQTVRGLELGVVADDITDVTEESLKNLKSPLKPVVRVATLEDIEKAAEMEALSREAMPIFKEMARETSDKMHPVSVEYLLDGDKAVFYFEAEERIDFRDLVRKLASTFHVRIDMHQIGVRDEARIVGGIAHCGQEVCCKRLGGEFKPVSIRMAKEQDLSLNPQKISGLCGRLMCCLRYEVDAYKDYKQRSPKMGATIHTPAGDGKVTDHDVCKETVSIKVADEKPVVVPLADFDEAAEGTRPDTVGEEAWSKANEKSDITFESSSLFSTSQFTGSDQLGDAKAHHHESSKGQKRQQPDTGSKSSGRTKGQGGGKTEDRHRQRRRRSTTIKGSERVETKGNSKDGSKANSKGSKSTPDSSSGKSKVRPGQKSSALSRNKDAKPKNAKPKGQSKDTNASAGTDAGVRKKRRRSHTVNKKDGSSK